MTHKLVRPRIIAFEVTRRCRYNCRHCRADAGCVVDEGELTTVQCKKIISAVTNFTRKRKRAPKSQKGAPAGEMGHETMIILTGGEPMERGDIYDIIRYGCARRLRMVMATCGYLIDDESIEKLKDSGVSALSFSLDGASPETHDAFRQAAGSFDSTVRAAQTAGAAGVRFQINSTISRINADEIAGIARLAERLGAYCFNAFLLVPTGRGAQIADAILDPLEYETVLNELLRLKLESRIHVRVTCAPQFSRLCRQKRLHQLNEGATGCIGGRDFAFISYRGDVQTCGFLNVSAGNLLENGYDFRDIWLNSELLKEVRDVSAYRAGCGVCEYVTTCGGCRARAYAMTGDYLAADPICSYKDGVDK
ncbi:MAG: radical SAM protein [Planctomycetota bacterium]|jgi:radical SAM protein with 4Fe4S-binding SPASM domain